MPFFIDPFGHSSFGIGLCARCSRKMSLDLLFDDPNYPGLKVCEEDRDEFDPYRLPPREPDPIALEFIRPDDPLIVPPNTIKNPIRVEQPGWPPGDSVSLTGITFIWGT